METKYSNNKQALKEMDKTSTESRKNVDSKKVCQGSVFIKALHSAESTQSQLQTQTQKINRN